VKTNYSQSVVVNKSFDINKPNNYLPPQVIEHKEKPRHPDPGLTRSEMKSVNENPTPS